MIHSLHVYTDISARVRDGVAVLEGYAWSRLQSQRLEELARSVSDRGAVGALPDSVQASIQARLDLLEQRPVGIGVEHRQLGEGLCRKGQGSVAQDPVALD